MRHEGIWWARQSSRLWGTHYAQDRLSPSSLWLREGHLLGQDPSFSSPQTECPLRERRPPPEVGGN